MEHGRSERQSRGDDAAQRRLAIADFRATRDYAARLRELGLADVRERRLGPRFWFGGPWTGTKLVTASKPA